MSSPALALPAPRVVLADAIPGARVRDAALILCGALLTVLGAQISIHVPPSPVPITGQTLAVVLAGGALGARRGASSQLLYLVLGLFLPVYSDGAQGFDVIWGATGGYIVGFIGPPTSSARSPSAAPTAARSSPASPSPPASSRSSRSACRG